MFKLDILGHLALGLGVRLLGVAYSISHDASSHVKYTDVDYFVYTDAAAYVVQGESPYRRETYRYTPLLAWLLTPNLTTPFPYYGKVLFSLFDILASYLIYLLALLEGGPRNKGLALTASLLWIYNPLPIAICSRGSCESIILCLVLAYLYLAKQKTVPFLTGSLLGFAVHFKIYPILHSLPLYLTTTTTGSLKDSSLLKNILTPSTARAKLVLGAALGFLLPTLGCYALYGTEFLQETYLYHLSRKDTRHNFSTYFYMLYLNWDLTTPIVLGILTFAPQAVLVLATAVLFRAPEDLIFTTFLQTYVFVSFNKVVTSQYFLWYLSLLPPLLPRLLPRMKASTGIILLLVWAFAQVAWLLPAYFLEFEGRNAFTYVWLESIAFFAANVGILVQIIKSYKRN